DSEDLRRLAAVPSRGLQDPLDMRALELFERREGRGDLFDFLRRATVSAKGLRKVFDEDLLPLAGHHRGLDRMQQLAYVPRPRMFTQPLEGSRREPLLRSAARAASCDGELRA